MESKDNIKIIYDGEYPNLCSGDLHIIIDDKEVYATKNYSFCSTGSIWFDDEWGEHIEYGELKWSNTDEKKKLEEFIQANYLDKYNLIMESIDDELSNYTPCCGGCI